MKIRGNQKKYNYCIYESFSNVTKKESRTETQNVKDEEMKKKYRKVPN